MTTQPLPEGFIRLKGVLSVFPVSRAEWYRGVKDGRFPAPIKLSPNIAAWRTSDIRALIARIESQNQIRLGATE